MVKLLGSTKEDVDKGKYGEDPPGHKTLWRRCNGVSLYVPVTSHVRPKLNTQRRLVGMSPRRLNGTSPLRLIGTL